LHGDHPTKAFGFPQIQLGNPLVKFGRLAYHTVEFYHGTIRLYSTSFITMAKRTAYQEKIIRRYYENKDDIMLQKLGEMVTDLYLAEGKAKQKVWDRIAAALKNLQIPETQIQHLMKADNPTLVANLLNELHAKK
jgi:hypothetical protein